MSYLVLVSPMKLIFPTTCTEATSPSGDIGTGTTGNDESDVNVVNSGKKWKNEESLGI